MTETSNSSPFVHYETAIGNKNQSFYAGKFRAFDQTGPGLKVSWNWTAFFFAGVWAPNRKMYGWFFAWWFVATVVSVFSAIPDAAIQLALAAVALAS